MQNPEFGPSPWILLFEATRDQLLQQTWGMQTPGGVLVRTHIRSITVASESMALAPHMMILPLEDDEWGRRCGVIVPYAHMASQVEPHWPEEHKTACYRSMDAMAKRQAEWEKNYPDPYLDPPAEEVEEPTVENVDDASTIREQNLKSLIQRRETEEAIQNEFRLMRYYDHPDRKKV